MHEAGDPPDSRAAKRRAEWFALRAHLAATLRDFDTADIWLERAIALTPQWAWVRTCQATVLELEDRYEGALAAARAAMDATPWYCPAVQSAAHLLTLLDRDAQAVELLAEAAEHVESVSVVGQLSGLLFELHDYHGAGAALDRCPELAPLGDRSFRRWLAAQRSEVAYHLGDVPAAIRHAKEVGREFFTTIAARLEDAGRAAARSVVLPVGFVRQHHVTCAPATLSAISRFWSQPADHLQVVDEICYDGTTAYNERQWAERHGWATREFTVTEPSAKALLDRGVPFTFATVNPGNAHLQAVIGYDGRRGTLWIRDPFWRNAREAIGDKLLEQYRAYGPRGMALVPERERVRLDGLDLPDAAQWDRLHGLDGALVRHCREEAATICAELSGAADGCRLGWEARRRLACYDANPTQRLAAVEQLLARCPKTLACNWSGSPASATWPAATSGWPSTRRSAGSGTCIPFFCSSMRRSCGPTPAAAARPSRCCGGPSAARRWNPAVTTSWPTSCGTSGSSTKPWDCTALPPASTTRKRISPTRTSSPRSGSSGRRRPLLSCAAVSSASARSRAFPPAP